VVPDGIGLEWLIVVGLLASPSMVVFSVWRGCIAMHGIFSKRQELKTEGKKDGEERTRLKWSYLTYL
jgi:hypothetical protein